MTTTAYLKAVPTSVADIPLQPASQDIWEKKYRLISKDGAVIDNSIDATYQRVARALADVEQTPELRETWYQQFLWALRHGAIPAGSLPMPVRGNTSRRHPPSTAPCRGPWRIQ